MAQDHPQVAVENRAALRDWLAAHHAQAGSIWLVTWKKGDPRHISYDDIVEEALCFGWIDSLPRKLDAQRTMLRLSPRKPGSGWSTVNKARIERLLAAGMMAPAGLAMITLAKADGSWTRLDGAGALTEPDDLRAALAAAPGAAGHWATFPPSTRRAILEWIAQARTAATRERRIQTTASEAAVGRRANQPRQPRPA
ncbi:hypothetical protein CAP39_01295 [Sphingomonas sp. IBVSS1]|nr:hypothetical protein CAP39_01295 [Sphingomonas sp. IBVSS1]